MTSYGWAHIFRAFVRKTNTRFYLSRGGLAATAAYNIFMSRKQIVALVAALVMIAGFYFKVPAPVVQALEDVVAALVPDDAAQPTAPKSESDAGSPGQ
jgi:hypothetical protein